MHAAFLDRLNLRHPIVQAPMAGVSTPQMAAVISNGGALGSLGIGAEDATQAERTIATARAATDAPFNVNLFCHPPARSRPAVEHSWLEQLRPEFAQYGCVPPAHLREIYTSFRVDSDMLEMLVQSRPRVVSFHFGLPDPAQIAALRSVGCMLFACATSLDEGRLIERAGLDAVIAQGFEAGGHRGMFDPAAPDECLSTLALTRLLVTSLRLPVIAAGGIMDGAGIAAALRLGAVAAQLGTAFIACPESAADSGYRAALDSDAADHTAMTSVISGRPARCLANRFTQWGTAMAPTAIPDYPIAYDAGKSLHAAAKTHAEYGYGAQWAGQGARRARSLPAADLLQALTAELAAARA